MKALAWFPRTVSPELRVQLGIPDDAPVRTEMVPGISFGERWRSYTVELVGLELPEGKEPESGRLSTFGDVRLDVRYQAVRLDGCESFLAWRWTEGGEDVTLSGLLHSDPRAAARLLAGLPLLRHMPAGREPRLTYSEDELSHAVREAVKKLHEARRRVTYLTVASHVGLSDRRLKAHVSHYGLDWQGMKRGR